MKLIDAFIFAISEYWNNRNLIFKLARANAKKQTIRTSLGIGWLYFRDIIYFAVYTFFRIVVAGNGKVDGISAALYVILGLVPWLFMNDVLNRGSTVIISNRGIVKSLVFPTIIFPTVEVISIFLQKVLNILIAIVLTMFLHGGDHINICGVIYYVFSMIVLMICINNIIEAFVAISADFQQFYLAFIRVLIYTLPVIWSFERIKNTTIRLILMSNPMAYIVDGFRNCFIAGFYFNLGYSCYFWIVVFILAILGFYVQYKLRFYYSDML